MTEEQMRKMVGPDVDLTEWREKNEFQKRYYESHAACPKCGSTGLGSTLVGYIVVDMKSFKDENSVWCGCGWTGITHDLVGTK